MATATGPSALDDKKVREGESPHDGARDVDIEVGVGGEDILKLEHTDPVLNAKVRQVKTTTLLRGRID